MSENDKAAAIRDAVEFTVRTLDLSRDPEANPLAKMCDQKRAEDMLRATIHTPTVAT